MSEHSVSARKLHKLVERMRGLGGDTMMPTSYVYGLVADEIEALLPPTGLRGKTATDIRGDEVTIISNWADIEGDVRVAMDGDFCDGTDTVWMKLTSLTIQEES